MIILIIAAIIIMSIVRWFSHLKVRMKEVTQSL